MANQNKNQGVVAGKDISAKRPAIPNKSSLDSAEMEREQSSQSQKSNKFGSEADSEPMNQPVNNPGEEIDDEDEELDDEDLIEDDTKVTGRHPSQRDRDLK